MNEGNAGFRQIRQEVQDFSVNLLVGLGRFQKSQEGVPQGQMVGPEAFVGIRRREDRQGSGVVDDLHGEASIQYLLVEAMVVARSGVSWFLLKTELPSNGMDSVFSLEQEVLFLVGTMNRAFAITYGDRFPKTSG